MAVRKSEAVMTKASSPQAVGSTAVSRAVRETITVGEIVSVGVLNLVRGTLVTAVKGTRDVGTEVGEAATAAVRGSMRAATEIGGDLGAIAKQAVRGAIQATEEIGGDLGHVARVTARGAVKAANDVGGKVAGKAIEGVVEGARDIGADVGSLARNAAEGAIEAADKIGRAAGRTVRSTLSEAVGGVRSLMGELRLGRSANSRHPRGGAKARVASPRSRPAR